MLKIKNIFLYKKLAYKQHKQYMLFRLLKYFIDSPYPITSSFGGVPASNLVGMSFNS